ncbi:MAG: hypothetical protein OEZ22_08950 [Spirochaetia bacterium]|nr:hypothetical protein [Spirochaetia bacterium]
MKLKNFIMAVIFFMTANYTGLFAQEDEMNSEPGSEPEIEERVEKALLSGYIRNYMGVLTNGDNNYAIIQNTFDTKIEKQTKNVGFKANSVLYHYPEKDIELTLREAYVDMYFKNMDIRIGKQQIIWGKADGVFITDIVSPKDMREFLLPDFEEIRIGVTGVKSDLYWEDHTLQFIWLPVFSGTRPPEINSIWRPEASFPVMPVFHEDNEKVENSLKNSEAFAKYSLMTSQIDFELMGGYTWDDDPVMHVYKTINPVTKQITALDVYPEYHRLAAAGGSFTFTLGPFVLRGEGAYYSGKYFNSTASELKDSVIEKNYVNYMTGVDFTIWDIKNSTQFIQKIILDHTSDLNDDKFQNLATYLISRDFLNETLNIQFFVYYDIDNKSSLMRPKITYKYADGFDILLAANIFTGSQGKFGQYNDNDMVYSKISYHF